MSGSAFFIFHETRVCSTSRPFHIQRGYLLKKLTQTTLDPNPYHGGCRESQSSLNASCSSGFSGNCMALGRDTPIPIPDGWTSLNQITPGQRVFDQAGHQCTVLAVCHRDAEPVFRVGFDDRTFLMAGAQQPWVTMTHRTRHRIRVGKFAIPDWASDFAPPPPSRCG